MGPRGHAMTSPRGCSTSTQGRLAGAVLRRGPARPGAVGERAVRGAARDGVGADVAAAGGSRGHLVGGWRVAGCRRRARSGCQAIPNPAPRGLRPPPRPNRQSPTPCRGTPEGRDWSRRWGTRRAASAAYVVRPAPDGEVAVAVEAVGACLASGRKAVVIVPEATPVPATARGARGGLRRAGGAVPGWVQTRAVPNLARDRARAATTWWWARDPPSSRPWRRWGWCSSRGSRTLRIARIELPTTTSATWRSPGRSGWGRSVCWPRSVPPRRRRRWGCRTWRRRADDGRPVEVVKPGSGGQAPRLVRALRDARRGFLLAPHPGYGIAAVCRSCGEPAACAACAGLLRMEEGVVRCMVCEAPGRCARCGARRFGIRRGGAERVQEWAARATEAHVHRLEADDVPASRPRERSSWAGPTTSAISAPEGSTSWASWTRISPSDARASRRASVRSPRGWRPSHGRTRAAAPSSRPAGRAIPPCRRSCAGSPIGSTPTRRVAARGGGLPRRVGGLPRRGYRRPRGRARGSRGLRLAHHIPRHVARGPDGMLARAGPCPGARVRAGRPCAGGPRRGDPGRSRAASVSPRPERRP